MPVVSLKREEVLSSAQDKAERARLSRDATSVAVLVAHSYVSRRSQSIDPAAAAGVVRRIPHMFVSLDEAQAAIDELHDLIAK